jgi:hypothetical protein
VAAPRRRRPGPQANGHILHSQPGVPAPGILELELEHPSDRYEILRHGGGTPTTLICGAVRFDHPVARNLVGILPPLLYIQASDEPSASWMQGVFRLMAAEARAFRPGGEAVIARLTDVREGATAAELAGRLGDQSEAAFGRAFKRVTGIPPGAAKRSAPVDAASRW